MNRETRDLNERAQFDRALLVPISIAQESRRIRGRDLVGAADREFLNFQAMTTAELWPPR